MIVGGVVRVNGSFINSYADLRFTAGHEVEPVFIGNGDDSDEYLVTPLSNGK